jgi:hypothetical protein
LKFTKGEQFFPYNVADYVKKSSLWVKAPNTPAEQLVPDGDLNLERLGNMKLEGARNVHYLQFISPMTLAEMAEFRFKELREAIRTREFTPSRSRLARVGFLSRLIDMVFSLVLLLRGRVPGDSAAAARLTFKKMLKERRTFQYYGRVVRESGWIVLQYWYFYPFNSWRSGFYGANDHEADWEMVNIYVYEDEHGEVKPSWVAYACHNFSGDDLRRHWDDPEVQKVGDHPIVYVGGGSHASYFTGGEYLTELVLPFFKSFTKLKRRMDTVLNKIFQENQTQEVDDEDKPQVFTIPFVDYATGDGLSIGQGCEESWAIPILIDPPQPWVKNFRGLWGYYAQDPFSGEDAPAGPRYNRDGTVRLAWFDPLGWAGMEKVIPPVEQSALLNSRKTDLLKCIEELTQEINHLQQLQYQRGFDLMAIRESSHLRGEIAQLLQDLDDERQLLVEKRRRLTVEQEKLEVLEALKLEDAPDQKIFYRAHIKHAHQPQGKNGENLGVLAEIWAAISIGLMLIGMVLLINFARPFLVYGLVGLLLLMITVEAVFKRQLANLVRKVAIFLAVISLAVLVYKFFWFILMAGAVIIGLYLIITNLRELFVRK